MRNIIPENGYLVYEDTHERVVFYECDPAQEYPVPEDHVPA